MKKSDGGYPNYWIDPSGRTFEVDMMGHLKFAFEYLEEKYSFDFFHMIREKSETCDATEYLESIGWKRVLTWPTGPTHFVSTSNVGKWTKKQKEAVFRICMDEDIDFPKFLMDN